MDKNLTSAGDFTWKELGRRIRDRRLQLGIATDQLAAVTGLSEPGLYRIERGGTNPQLESLQRIAAALDSSVRELLCGVARPTGRAEMLLSRAARLLALNEPIVEQLLANALDTAEALLERLHSRAPFPRRPAGQNAHPTARVRGTKSISEEEEDLIRQSLASPNKSGKSLFQTTRRKDREDAAGDMLKSIGMLPPRSGRRAQPSPALDARPAARPKTNAPKQTSSSKPHPSSSGDYE